MLAAGGSRRPPALLQHGGSPGRLCLTPSALTAMPFPAERKTVAKSSKPCHGTSPIPGQRLPQRRASLPRQERPNPQRPGSCGGKEGPGSAPTPRAIPRLCAAPTYRSERPKPAPTPPAKLRWGRQSPRALSRRDGLRHAARARPLRAPKQGEGADGRNGGASSSSAWIWMQKAAVLVPDSKPSSASAGWARSRARGGRRGSAPGGRRRRARPGSGLQLAEPVGVLELGAVLVLVHVQRHLAALPHHPLLVLGEGA